MRKKLERLKNIIQRYRSAVIAFSGGVDSTLLARIAGHVLEKRVLLVTVSSPLLPPAELSGARSLAAALGLRHRVIDFGETAVPGFADNRPDRCYHCKRAIFSKIRDIAEREKYGAVFDGSNADDTKDFRPGMKARAEFGVVSPLGRAGMTKRDIRVASARYGLLTAGRPSSACLASRFPYGENITAARLRKVGEAESAVRKLGFRQFRVRFHGGCARVEIDPAELDTAWRNRRAISRACRKAGFAFVALDTDGYRTGAINEALGTTD